MYKTIHTLIAVAVITEVSGRGVSHPVLEVKCIAVQWRSGAVSEVLSECVRVSTPGNKKRDTRP